MARRKKQGGTYFLVDQFTREVVRVGQTSDLHTRELAHRRDPILGAFEFFPDRFSNSYPARRGREQIIHDMYHPRLDKQEPISPRNKNRAKYLAAGRKL